MQSNNDKNLVFLVVLLPGVRTKVQGPIVSRINSRFAPTRADCQIMTINQGNCPIYVLSSRIGLHSTPHNCKTKIIFQSLYKIIFSFYFRRDLEVVCRELDLGFSVDNILPSHHRGRITFAEFQKYITHLPDSIIYQSSSSGGSSGSSSIERQERQG